MPNWGQILDEVRKHGHTTDGVRRRYLTRLHRLTKRNVIIYYSGWLQKRQTQGGAPLDFAIGDIDKNGFMSVIHGLDRSLGLDLLLHTPGGDMAATESIIDYLRQMFGNDIRAIIPQIAMSGGSMIACSCKEIVMGRQSNLGPFDPQINGMPAQAILAEFQRAAAEIKTDQSRAFMWQPIFGKLGPGFLTLLQNAIDMADSVMKQQLVTCMFAGQADADAKAQTVLEDLGSHAATHTHARHIHKDRAKALGLKIVDLEADPKLQDAVLSVHHSCMIAFEQAAAFKIIENHNGDAYMMQAQNLLVVPH